MKLKIKSDITIAKKKWGLEIVAMRTINLPMLSCMRCKSNKNKATHRLQYTAPEEQYINVYTNICNECMTADEIRFSAGSKAA